MDSATGSGAWKKLFLLVGFFQSWNGIERREGLVRFQAPTRVNKLRGMVREYSESARSRWIRII